MFWLFLYSHFYQMNSINLTYSCNRNCNYCFAKGFLKKWPQEMSLKELKTVFEWFSKQGIKNSIAFSGGEPTFFSKVNVALKMAESYGFKIRIYTNGIFDVEKTNIESPAISSFLINLNPLSEYSSQEIKTLYFNLKSIRKITKNIDFRFNIVSPDISYNYIIDACKKLNIHYVEFAPVFPSILGKNKYIKKENLKNFARYILQFTKDLLKQGIRGQLAEPFPLCFFSEKERNFLVKNVGLSGVCGAGKNYAITPDLTVLPCVVFAFKERHLNSFKNEKEIIDYYKKPLNELRWETDLFPECKNCLFKKNKQCQGSCLAYKLL